MADKAQLIDINGLAVFLEGIRQETDEKFEAKIWKGTKAECDAAIAAGEIPIGSVVIITDDLTRRDVDEDGIDEAIENDIF